MINRRKLHVLLDSVVAVSAFLTEGLTADLVSQSFDRGADYVRKVKLRGEKAELEAEEYSIIKQTQYTDIGASDNYLQLQMAAGAAIAGRFVDILLIFGSQSKIARLNAVWRVCN